MFVYDNGVFVVVTNNTRGESEKCFLLKYYFLFIFNFSSNAKIEQTQVLL